MKILFITCSRIGDAVLTTPVLSHILSLYPRARVSIAADPLVASLLDDYPGVHELILFPKEKHSLHWLKLWQKVVGTSWDMVIDLRGSIISYGLRTKQRFVWKSIKNDPRHKVAQICGLLNFPLVATCIWTSQKRLEKARRHITPPTLAMAPAANWVGKQWPLDNFITIAQRWFDSVPDGRIAVFCAPHEANSIMPLLALNPEKTAAFVDGTLSLCDVAAHLKCCQVFLGNDSGLMHMSAAVGTPTVGLFGPSRENNYGPWEDPTQKTLKHRVVRIPQTYDVLSQSPGFSHQSQECYMKGIHPKDVWHAVHSVFQENK